MPLNMQNYLFYQQNPAILIFLTKCNFKKFMLWKWKLPIFEKQIFLSITFPLIIDLTWNIDEINDFLKGSLWWPFLAFIVLCGLGWIFKAKSGLCRWKLSTIDLFPTFRCQKQSPNEIGHFESLCERKHYSEFQVKFVKTNNVRGMHAPYTHRQSPAKYHA